MAISLKHAFTSAIADGGDTSLVQPSNWNAEHNLTMATSRILGRTTAGTGSAEEISVGANLSLSGGTLSVSGLGTIATQDANNVSITGGSITGITDLAVADGGTGKSSFTAYSVLLGGTTSTGALQNVSGVGSSGQVLTSAGASAVPTWKFPSANLIGTIVTTSGTSASISGLDLTPYKLLIVVFDGVSHNSGSGQTLLLGTSTADDIPLSTSGTFGAAATVRGIVTTDLTSGVSTSFVDNFASGANGTIPSRFAGLPIRTSSTSVSVAFSAGSLDAGAVYVYGI